MRFVCKFAAKLLWLLQCGFVLIKKWFRQPAALRLLNRKNL
jgi:hypothetical protein